MCSIKCGARNSGHIIPPPAANDFPIARVTDLSSQDENSAAGGSGADSGFVCDSPPPPTHADTAKTTFSGSQHSAVENSDPIDFSHAPVTLAPDEWQQCFRGGNYNKRNFHRHPPYGPQQQAHNWTKRNYGNQRTEMTAQNSGWEKLIPPVKTVPTTQLPVRSTDTTDWPQVRPTARDANRQSPLATTTAQVVSTSTQYITASGKFS